MDALNALLTPTWNRLALNGTAVDLPCWPAAAAEAVNVEVPKAWDEVPEYAFEKRWHELEDAAREQSARRLTVRSTDDVDPTLALEAEQAAKDPLDVPAKNAIPRSATSSALGDEALVWINGVANKKTYVVPTYSAADGPLVIRVAGEPGAAAVAAVNVVVEEGARARICLQADSPRAGKGLVGVSLRVIAAENAVVDIATLETLDATWTYLESIELKLAENARVETGQTYLGAGESFIGFGAPLQGFRSSIAVQTNYLGAENIRDLNYLVRHFGKQTKSDLVANGVLAKGANKSLRATIDLIHGAKGAKGHELESVLIADDGVKNRSLPIILCDEDDVQGDHGATIGHVPAAQRYYLAARGLDDDAINALFLQASFEKAYVEAFDQVAAASVDRLARTRLGAGVADLG